MSFIEAAVRRVDAADGVGVRGRIGALRGLTMRVRGLRAPVGRLVVVHASDGPVLGEVVGFDDGGAIVMAMGASAGVREGDAVEAAPTGRHVGAGDALLGRVVNGLGAPIDAGPPPGGLSPAPITPPPLGAMERSRIRHVLPTGVRALDVFATLGRGQRLGLFAGPGVGKSTLLGMIARRASSDVNVIALIGERGREVRDFIEEALGEDGLARSVLVVSTSDESPLMRVRAANAACAIAEHFRDRGRDVLLMVDSLTRFAHAQRQIGLSVGEPPATKGYTPSVFAGLPLLLERAGPVEPGRDRAGGSITGLYTVLVEGDDMSEPVADAVRGILDGHVKLERRLAQRGHFPAIDVLDSVSRVADSIITPAHRDARRAVTSLLAAHREVEELVQIGAYASGSNPTADAALELRTELDALLRQGVDEAAPFPDSVEAAVRLAARAAALRSGAHAQPGRPRGDRGAAA